MPGLPSIVIDDEDDVEEGNVSVESGFSSFLSDEDVDISRVEFFGFGVDEVSLDSGSGLVSGPSIMSFAV